MRRFLAVAAAIIMSARPTTACICTLMLAAELADGSGYWVNVCQEGAKFYGVPRKCNLPGCN